MLLALVIAAEEGGTAEAAPNPILPVSYELFWGAIAFGLLFLLVNFVLLPPVLRAMRDREATIKADHDAADAARAKVVSASAEADDQLAEVRGEAATTIDDARQEADAERQRIMARAEREVAAMKEIAENEIAGERETALQSLRPQVADLAVGAASRVMNQPVDANAARPVVERVLNN